MKKYNFDYLTWFDFEGLARDIIELRENIKLEGFAPGIDGGIDFRHASDKERNLIVQCKHYKTFSPLYQNLKKEVAKVKKIKPSRYILVTSVNINPNQKQKVIDLFCPYIREPGDVICGNDIEQDLDKNSGLLKKNHKLWLTSSKVLELVLQKKIIGRSNQLAIDMKHKAKIYVETQNVQKSINLLDQNNYIIIAGAPGVGKTTLAQILALYYVKEGYELAYVTNVEEAENMMAEGEDQPPRFIYYDDFLGTNLLKSSPYRNEDKRLVSLFRRVRASKKTKLIMTTREYILRQATSDYEALESTDIDLTKIVVEISSYTPFQKAQILYNHLYYSKLRKTFLNNIVKAKNYERIIRHRNYNPRLIEAMTNSDGLLRSTASAFTNDFVALLENPIRVWERAFESHIHEISRFIIYSLYISPQKITLESLKENVYRVIKTYSSKTGMQVPAMEFLSAIKEIDGTFIETSQSEGKTLVSFANPSIIDFLTHRLNKITDIKEVLLENITHLDPFLERFSLSSEKNATHLNLDLQYKFTENLIKKFDLYEDAPKNSIHLLRRLNKIDYMWDKHYSPQLTVFMVDRLKTLELPETYTDYDLSTYVRLIEKFKLDTTARRRQIVSHVIHNVSDVDDLKKITTVNLYFEEELLDIALMNTIDLPQLFAEIVDSYEHSISDLDAGQLETLLEEIEEVETSMGYDLTIEKEPITLAMAAKNAEDDKLPAIDLGAATKRLNDIDDLFQTLVA